MESRPSFVRLGDEGEAPGRGRRCPGWARAASAARGPPWRGSPGPSPRGRRRRSCGSGCRTGSSPPPAPRKGPSPPAPGTGRRTGRSRSAGGCNSGRAAASCIILKVRQVPPRSWGRSPVAGAARAQVDFPVHLLESRRRGAWAGAVGGDGQQVLGAQHPAVPAPAAPPRLGVAGLQLLVGGDRPPRRRPPPGSARRPGRSPRSARRGSAHGGAGPVRWRGGRGGRSASRKANRAGPPGLTGAQVQEGGPGGAPGEYDLVDAQAAQAGAEAAAPRRPHEAQGAR